MEICLTGGQALQIVEENCSRFDVILLDLGLPDIPGERLLPKILGMAPAAKVLVVSGTPYESTHPRVSSLLKPFTPQMLIEALANL